MTRSFNKIAGDASTYSVGDGEGAVRLAKEAGSVAVDIETAGLGAEAWNLKAFIVADSQHAHVLDPWTDDEAIRDVLSAATELVVHNSPFDVPLLVGSGLMHADDCSKVLDTLLASRMAAPAERHSLGVSCERNLGGGYSAAKDSLAASYRAVTGKSKSQMFRELGLWSDPYVSYAGFDGIMTARLRAVLPDAVAAWTTDHPFPTSGDPAYLLHREQTINRMLLRRSSIGIEVDMDELEAMQGVMMREQTEASRTLVEHGVDIEDGRAAVKASAMQRLDELGKIPKGHRRLNDGTPSADKKLRARIGHPIIEALERWAMAERFSIDYAEKANGLTHDGRIHPQINVMLARTGRMSVGTPPLQQYPAAVRRIFRFDAPASSLDWASVEPVYFANVVGESLLLDRFEVDSDVKADYDLYLPIADAAGCDRSTAKVVLLAQLYGQGAPSLGTQLGISEADAYDLVRAVMSTMPRIAAATKKIKNVSEKFGKVQTMSGRIVPQDPDPRTANERHFGYIGVNHLVQGSCLDLLSEAIYEMHNRGLDDALYMAVHDELVVDTDAADEVEQIMQTPPSAFCEAAGRTPRLRVGRADLGRNWEEKS